MDENACLECTYFKHNYNCYKCSELKTCASNHPPLEMCGKCELKKREGLVLAYDDACGSFERGDETTILNWCHKNLENYPGSCNQTILTKCIRDVENARIKLYDTVNSICNYDTYSIAMKAVDSFEDLISKYNYIWFNETRREEYSVVLAGMLLSWEDEVGMVEYFIEGKRRYYGISRKEGVRDD